MRLKSGILLNPERKTNILLLSKQYRTPFYSYLLKVNLFSPERKYDIYWKHIYPRKTRALPCPSIYTPQSFAFPTDVMNRIMSCMNHKIYKKLIQTCKYFYFKEQKLLANELTCRCMVVHDAMKIPSTYCSKPSKIWITEKLFVHEKYAFTEFLSKIYRCDAFYVSISKAILTEKEFDLCINPNKVETLLIDRMFIGKLDSTLLKLEDVIAKVPNATTMILLNMEFTHQTAEELVNLKLNKKVKHFCVSKPRESFNLIAFCKFIQINAATMKSKFGIRFNEAISQNGLTNAKNLLQELENSWNAQILSKQASYYFRCTNDSNDKEFSHLFYDSFL